MPDLPAAEVNARQGFAAAPAEREKMEYDVVITGGGPAGLAAAIRLKQCAAEKEQDISVCLLEKGAEIGAHILSGAVIDPRPLTRLIPDWQEQGAPLTTAANKERFLFLTKNRAIPFPNLLLPPMMKNHGCYIASLGALCKWLGERAAQMGVEIYPGFAAAETLFDDAGALAGVATGDMGLDKNGQKKAGWTSGIEIHGKYTVLAEGARGSLTKFLTRHFDLAQNASPQKYGIGIKELWRVAPENHRPGFVQHTLGWPLDNKTGGGSFLYHFGENRVAVGFVVHLDYANPYISPFDEFQRFKTHPAIRPVFAGGERLAYGARAVTEGGLQSVPQLAFPGGVLAGCAAGFLNVPRLKGSHNAIASGMLAAEAIASALAEGRSRDTLIAYQTSFAKSEIRKELARVRNVKPFLSRYNLFPGLLFGGMDMWMRTLKLGLPFTLKHKKADHQCIQPAAQAKPVAYPKPDGKVSFDKLSSVFLSATNHEEDQPAHLTLADPNLPVTKNLPEYDEPAQRYCPAGVYEIVDGADGKPKLQINAQNCVHCKTCDIKDPAQNINWVVPEGGGGPNYADM